MPLWYAFLRLEVWFNLCSIPFLPQQLLSLADKQRVLTPGHQGWNDLHSLCRIGMEYYLLNNDDNNNKDDDDDDNRNNNNNDL